MRSVLKGLVEAVGTGSGLTAIARRITSDAVAVLAYHNVVPEGEAGRGDASLHLPLPRFIAQVERLAATHEIVALNRIFEPRRSARPRAVITFDDAYRGAVTLALPELARRGIPATVFVAPELLGAAHTWWDALAEAGVLDAAARERALVREQGHHANILPRALPHGALPALPPAYGIATEAELRTHCTPGIAVGSHTWSHEYLPSLDEAVLAVTLVRSLDWVRSFAGERCMWLAAPYGGGSEALGRSAMALGYEGLLRVDGGVWRNGGNTAWVPRINVPSGLSTRGLEIRASGAFARG